MAPESRQWANMAQESRLKITSTVSLIDSNGKRREKEERGKVKAKIQKYDGFKLWRLKKGKGEKEKRKGQGNWRVNVCVTESALLIVEVLSVFITNWKLMHV